MTNSDAAVRRDVFFGIGGASVSYPLSVITIKSLFKNFPGDKFFLSKNYEWIFQVIGNIQSSLLRGICKTFLVGYLVVIGPILEEWVFRGALYHYQTCHLDVASRILSNSVLFGAIHLSYFHGAASIPYFLVATISGLVYACLREWTGSWRAPAIAHGISNACVIAFETMR